MADYAEMYKVLFRVVTEAIEMLQQAQQATEEIYVSDDGPVIAMLPPNNDVKNKDAACSPKTAPHLTKL